MILVYTLVFSQIMQAKLPGTNSMYAYSIYLCTGILTWNFFSEIIGRSQGVFIENANLLKKLSFPRICLPVIISTSAFLNFLIIFILFLIFITATNNFPGLPLAATIPLILLQTTFALGLGITVGVLNVFFRDVGQLMGVLLQLWFWFTPIIYPITIIPSWARQYIAMNPMTNLMNAYQTIFVQHQWPDWTSLWLVTMLSALMLALGLHLFRKHSADMVDEL
ncbi:ABC-2 type transporter [compost metagenome]